MTGLGLTGAPVSGRPRGTADIAILFGAPCSKGREALACKERCYLLSHTLLCPRQRCLTDRGGLCEFTQNACASQARVRVGALEF